MHIRHAEFLTEIILSFFVLVITIQTQANPEFSVGSIAVIHSLNAARALEAYKQAKVQQQQNLSDYND
jgi:hypothetical protein